MKINKKIVVVVIIAIVLTILLTLIIVGGTVIFIGGSMKGFVDRTIEKSLDRSFKKSSDTEVFDSLNESFGDSFAEDAMEKGRNIIKENQGKTVEQFLIAMNNDDLNSAYDQMHSSFQKGVSLEEFKSAIDKNPYIDSLTGTFFEGSMQMSGQAGVATISGVIVAGENDFVNASFMLKNDKDQAKIVGIILNGVPVF